MQKLKLNIEALAVESFTASPTPTGRGTAHGFQADTVRADTVRADTVRIGADTVYYGGADTVYADGGADTVYADGDTAIADTAVAGTNVTCYPAC
jgi:hypothetical protein